MWGHFVPLPYHLLRAQRSIAARYQKSSLTDPGLNMGHEIVRNWTYFLTCINRLLSVSAKLLYFCMHFYSNLIYRYLTICVKKLHNLCGLKNLIPVIIALFVVTHTHTFHCKFDGIEKRVYKGRTPWLIYFFWRPKSYIAIYTSNIIKIYS